VPSDSDLVRGLFAPPPASPLLGEARLVPLPHPAVTGPVTNRQDDLRLTKAIDTTATQTAALELPLVEIPVPGMTPPGPAPAVAAATPVPATTAPAPAPPAMTTRSAA